MPSDIVVYRARADPPAGTLERRTEHTLTTAAELRTLIEQVPAIHATVAAPAVR
jgi:hypothetical protein